MPPLGLQSCYIAVWCFLRIYKFSASLMLILSILPVFCMMQVGAEKNLLVKDHTHTFVNKGGNIGGMIMPFLKYLCSAF